MLNKDNMLYHVLLKSILSTSCLNNIEMYIRKVKLSMKQPSNEKLKILGTEKNMIFTDL